MLKIHFNHRHIISYYANHLIDKNIVKRSDINDKLKAKYATHLTVNDLDDIIDGRSCLDELNERIKVHLNLSNDNSKRNVISENYWQVLLESKAYKNNQEKLFGELKKVVEYHKQMEQKYQSYKQKLYRCLPRRKYQGIFVWKSST